MEHHQDVRSLRPGAIVAGVILLVLGGGMLLDTTGVMHVRIGRLIAPLVLISIGVTTMLSHANCRDGSPTDPTKGLWWIFLGAWLMASQTQVFGLTFATSWPILVILTGLMMVIRGMR